MGTTITLALDRYHGAYTNTDNNYWAMTTVSQVWLVFTILVRIRSTATVKHERCSHNVGAEGHVHCTTPAHVSSMWSITWSPVHSSKKYVKFGITASETKLHVELSLATCVWRILVQWRSCMNVYCTTSSDNRKCSLYQSHFQFPKIPTKVVLTYVRSAYTKQEHPRIS